MLGDYTEKEKFDMSITKQILISTALFAAASLSAETFTLNKYDANVNWNDTSIWDVSGATSPAFPENGGDVVLKGNSSGQYNLTVNGNYKIDSLNVEMTGSKHYRISISGSNTLEIANDSVIDAAYNWNQLMFSGTGTLDFKKNLTVKNDIGDGLISRVAFGESSQSALSAFKVGGDLNIQKNTKDDISVYFNALNVSIGGKINIASGATLVFARNTKGLESNLTVGGLEGPGTLVLGFDSGSYYGSKSVANIKITNGGSWQGKFTKYTTHADSRLNVTMDGTGTQNFRVSEYTACEGATNSNIIDTLTVKSGVFNYGADDYVSGSLVLDGGTFSIAAQTDAGSTAPDIGIARFGSGTLNSGTLLFDIAADATFDKLVFSGKLNKGDGSFGLEFQFDAEGMKELIESDAAKFEDIITYESGSDIEDTVLNGVSNGFMWEAVFGATGADVTFSVPEPSEIAAVFGLCALLFAAYRRRK